MRVRAVLMALIAAPALSAAAAELPPRKPGLWETRAVIDGRVKTIRRCFRSGERSAFLESVGVESCRKSAYMVAGGYILNAECRTRGRILTGRLKIVGDFSSEVRGGVKTIVEREDGSADPYYMSMTFTGRRLGACAPAREQ